MKPYSTFCVKDFHIFVVVLRCCQLVSLLALLNNTQPSLDVISKTLLCFEIVTSLQVFVQHHRQFLLYRIISVKVKETEGFLFFAILTNLNNTLDVSTLPLGSTAPRHLAKLTDRSNGPSSLKNAVLKMELLQGRSSVLSRVSFLRQKRKVDQP